MTFQRGAAAACAVAGVLMLAGLGWALLTAAAILFVATPTTMPRLQAVSARVGLAGRRVWLWLLTGRQAVAAASMPVAMVALAGGISLALGVGWGLAVAGVSIGYLSLAADRAA